MFGLLLRAGARLTARKRPDRLVSFAWSVSLCLVIAWTCILAVGAFSFGYAPSDGVILTLLALGLVGGCVHALLALGRNPSSEEA